MKTKILYYVTNNKIFKLKKDIDYTNYKHAIMINERHYAIAKEMFDELQNDGKEWFIITADYKRVKKHQQELISLTRKK